MTHPKAFTLIELLIVVAIIAILAAIAVPNFLEAQTRSKVSRVKSDLRTFANGIETYRVDWNRYPKGTEKQYSVAEPAIAAAIGFSKARVLERLSTPIAYLTNGALKDPFTSVRVITPSKIAGAGPTGSAPVPAADREIAQYYKYTAFTPGQGAFVSALVDRDETSAMWAWAMWSPGPDLGYIILRGSNLLASAPFGAPQVGAIYDQFYDPSNGTISAGDVFRLGGVRTGAGSAGDIFISNALPLTSR